MECFLSQVRLAWCFGYLCWFFSWMAEMTKYLEILRSRSFFRDSIGDVWVSSFKFSKQVLIFRGSILHTFITQACQLFCIKSWFHDSMRSCSSIFLQGCRCMFMDDYCLYCFVYIVRLVSEMHFPKQPHPNRSQARFWLGFGDFEVYRSKFPNPSIGKRQPFCHRGASIRTWPLPPLRSPSRITMSKVLSRRWSWHSVE